MVNAPLKRRLAAVFALDVAGYSRLMQGDEEGTHARVTTAIRDTVTPAISEHQGHVFKGTGDGVLAEFASVFDATRCAIAIQRAMHASEQPQPPETRIQFRIGINLGDVIVEPPEIYGDGVNIAVRLEALAEVGGICVSGLVADQVGDKLGARFINMGLRNLKNIAKPVRVFQIAVLDQVSPPSRSNIFALPEFERPAIAVLPFKNMSGDADQEYFADGLTEDVITALAGWRSFPIIARNSMFTYKGQTVDVKTIGREVGAQYVLEGTVRRQASRVRVSAELIDVETNHCLYAERYDRDLTDIFALQDEIRDSIVGALEPELVRVEMHRAVRSAGLFSAYDFLQRGLWHHYRYTDEDNLSAQDFFRKSLDVAPNYVEANAALAVSLVHRMLHGWEKSDGQLLNEALTLARRAVSLEPSSPHARYALALSYFHTGNILLAIHEMEAVINLHPSHAVAWANLGNLRNYVNQPEKATQAVMTALRLSPNDPRQFIWMAALAGSYYLAGRYEEAVEAGKRGYALKPDFVAPLRYVIASFGQMDRIGEAKEFLPILRQSDADLSACEIYLRRYYVDLQALQHILAGLARAGF